jgi:hypothetical protein
MKMKPCVICDDDGKAINYYNIVFSKDILILVYDIPKGLDIIYTLNNKDDWFSLKQYQKENVYWMFGI